MLKLYVSYFTVGLFLWDTDLFFSMMGGSTKAHQIYLILELLTIIIAISLTLFKPKFSAWIGLVFMIGFYPIVCDLAPEVIKHPLYISTFGVITITILIWYIFIFIYSIGVVMNRFIPKQLALSINAKRLLTAIPLLLIMIDLIITGILR